jgi:hypothetical protein
MVNPGPGGTAQLDAESTDSTVYKVSCTWSFPHVLSGSLPTTLHVGVNYGSNISPGPNGNHCIGGSASLTGSGLSWHTSCNSGQLMETAEVPANIYLDSLSGVTAEVQTVTPNSQDDNALLEISTIYIQ